MAAERLRPNPSGCVLFERNVFRAEKCRHCGHHWQLHKDAISESDVRAFVSGQRQTAQERANAEAEAKAKARAKAQAKQRAQRAVEDNWLFDDAMNDASEFGSAESDEEGFRMFAGNSLQSAPVASRNGSGSSFRPLRIVNLVDFGECDVRDAREARPSSSANSSGRRSMPAAVPSHGPPSGAGVGPAPRQPQAPPQEHRGSSRFSTPMQSKDDVLLEEIQYLRQMLADANEEKNIQLAIVRDELADKQKLIDELSRREVSFRLSRSADEHAEGAEEEQQRLLLLAEQGLELEKCREELRARRDLEQELRAKLKQCMDEQRDSVLNVRELERRGEVLNSRLSARERELERISTCVADLATCQAELRDANARLARREASSDVLAACRTEAELRAWEVELRETTQLALDRLAGRRVELRVAAIMEAQETALCKICYEHPASCALLPCRHHAFCKPCAVRVENSHDKACPICRTLVSGRFETFAS